MFRQTPELFPVQPPVQQEVSIIYTNKIDTASIYNRFTLSLGSKEATGTCTCCVPRNHWCYWESPPCKQRGGGSSNITTQIWPLVIYGQWHHHPHLFPYIMDDISGSCHSAMSTIRVSHLCWVVSFFSGMLAGIMIDVGFTMRDFFQAYI